MESDRTAPGMSGPHPTITELRDPQDPHHFEHLTSCSLCRSVVAADHEDAPIPLDLPKGLVSENAFRWPADPIARGGMAQIYAGEDKRLARTVILKAPRDDDQMPEYMRDMFQRRVSAEARVLAKLQHPAIVKIYELGKASVGWPFCVLEKVDGVSLRDRLDELADQEAADGQPRTRERLELLSNLVSIAEALAYAHERHVVHRDCTPNNILLGKRGEATLIDWGIARDLDAPTVSSEPKLSGSAPGLVASGQMTISAGTPPYLPLEQSQGKQADPSFDVYSFGVTLYEVVSGKTPFPWKPASSLEGRTAQMEQFLGWLQKGERVAPAMPRDSELSGIIRRAMAHDPDDRFTADELVRALKQYLTGDLVFSHRYSLTGRLARWARRNRAASVTMAFVILSGVAGALVWAQVSRMQKEDADLRAMASAARADASEKERAADAASREAESAKALAEQAQREGKNAEELRHAADRKRHAAEEMRRQAEAAATQAKGTADEAVKRFEEAMKEKEDADRQRDEANADRDAARAAQAAAEQDRETARAAQAAAEKERDTSNFVAKNAVSERDAARAAREAAEKDRDGARAAQVAAEKERDAAIAARAAVEKERDEAKKKLEELKAKDQAPAPAPAPAPTPAPAP
ncbi:MAG TPA: protein kinase [Kofleriaceae bacterium]|nr:protein kinase [Kofleriaceae bacterium]